MGGVRKRILHAIKQLKAWSGGDLFDDERVALRLLLAGTDPRLIKLRLQWVAGRSFVRGRDSLNTTFTKWRFTEGCLSHELLTTAIESREIVVQTGANEWQYACSAAIAAGGWCAKLKMRQMDRAAQQPVCLSESDQCANALVLPEIAEQGAAFERFERAMPDVRLFLSRYGNIELTDGISEERLQAWERHCGHSFPFPYRQFLLATNGMLCGERVIVKCEDAIHCKYLTEHHGSPVIMLATDIINGLVDGAWYLPLVGNPEANVHYVDMYGERTEPVVCFSQFLNELLVRARAVEDEVAELEEKYARVLSEWQL